MSNIQINDIDNNGLDLFNDSESFMNEIQTDDLNGVVGGGFQLNKTVLSGRTIIVLTPTKSTILTTRSTILTTGPYSPVEL